ncbi:MAG: T9SS type A sorting domain-containing protein [Ferruginibacter sp.]
MRNLNVVTASIFLLMFSVVCRAQDGKFTFTISVAANTSAGVFKDDSILVKTLWNNVHYNAGTYTSTWDGKDDNGVSVVSAATNFEVKIVSSNVKYQWQGVLGNTSRVQTGSGVHRGYYHCMRGLVFTNGYGYYCRGYAEGAPSLAKFKITDPQYKIDFANTKQPGDINYVATDDNNVYWGVGDAYANPNTFVFATRVNDDSDVNFSNGTPYSVTFGKTYPKAISVVNQVNSEISGLAVQKQGNYLFVARAGLNQLQVLDKTTGALVKTLSFTSPKSICVDKADNLWMITGTNKVAKYDVNSDGSLSAPILTLSGLLKPAAIQVSTDGALITVADDSTSQQVKFFNNTTGVPTATLGTAGGYLSDPDVDNNKFYFNDLRSRLVNFIAYQPDGSFWVNDPGNYRAQHYTAGRAFINTIQSLGATYQTGVDKNNITRVFSDNLEFAIDYSVQNLSATAGWKLVKNWGANIPATSTSLRLPYGVCPKYQTTLSNGRTYGFLLSGYNYEVVEYPANGPMRFTGTRVVEMSKRLCDDGALQDYTDAGSTGVFKRYPLLGFDVLNNPQWDTAPEILATAPTSSTGNPTVNSRTQIITSSNKIVMYNYKAWSNNVGPVFSTGFHLGIMNRGGSTWLAQTEKSTHRNYVGDFPESGYFDVGNMVNDFAGGNVNVFGRNIVTSYHGEFWKNGQTNMYNHYWDNGLAIGQFGITRAQTTGESAAMMAGNVLTPLIVKDAKGDYYLYHGDESDHAGVHRWKITGLNTISEQVITLAAPTTYAERLGYVDLMKGLPFDAVMPNNTAGWTRYPATNDVKDKFADAWSVFTGRLKYDTRSSPDLLVNFIRPYAGTYSINRDLGNTSVTYSWKISGEIAYPSNMPNGSTISQYFEVLDDNGKVLTRFYPAVDRYVTPFVASINFNNKVIASGSETTIKKNMTNALPFEVKIINGVATFTYGNYPPVTTTIFDASGDWKSPKTMRCVFYSLDKKSFPTYAAIIGLQDCKYYKDFVLPASVNELPVANAGNDRDLIFPTNSATLNGSAIDPDGTISSYLWTKILGPAGGTIASIASANTTVSGLGEGLYRYQLKVTDNNGAISIDTVQLTVTKLNEKPIVKAGSDITITFPTLLTTLTGTASDPDGRITSSKWTKISGPLSFLIALPGSLTTALTGLVPGVYTYELQATDDSGAVVKDTVVVTVKLSLLNRPPLVNAGVDKTMTLPQNSLSLFGSGSDPDGLVRSYSWTKVSGPSLGVIASPNAATSIMYNLAMGVYQFELAVTDNSYAVSRDTVQVTIKAGTVNQIPTVNAGPDKGIIVPANTAAVRGSGSDLDGTITSILWSKISGPSSYFIHTPDSFSTNFSLLVDGVYEIELKVTDNKGASKTDTIKITVKNPGLPAPVNQPPVPNAGPDKVLTLPTNSVTLTGSATDPDGSITKYSWTKVGGLGAYTIVSPSSASTVVSNLQAGSHQFQLRVTDNGGSIADDYVQVTVGTTSTNIAPTANAGPDIATTSLSLTTTLRGSGTDPDGTISKYAWSKISGPLTVGISSPGSASTVITNLLPGVYQFQLTVTDNDGAIGTDIVVVTVSLLLTNQPPVANAGADNTITLPNNTIALSGSGTDADGSISSYSWTRVSGPGSVVISTPNAAATSVKNLTQGVHKFQLTVTDNDGDTDVDEVQVTVNPPSSNKIPTAKAGADKTIKYPTSSVTLSGSGTDSDGNVATYSWATASAPATGSTIASPGSPTTVISNLVPGVYIFQLKVVDNVGGFGFDYVQVTVQAAISGRTSTSTSTTAVAVAPPPTPVITAPKFNNYKANDLAVYPNPVASSTNLDITSIDPATTLSITVYNTVGVMMLHKETRSTRNKTLYNLDLSTLATGAYFVTVRFSDGTAIQKKIIKN